MAKKYLSMLCILLSSLVLIACDGHTSVRGHVYDKKGKPIEGALVLIETGRDIKFDIQTDKEGYYAVGVTHAPFEVQLTLTVSKEGYKQYKKIFSSREEPKGDYKIVLEKISSTDGEAKMKN